MWGEQIPIAPREAHGVPLGAEVRNAMPMRPLNQDFRVRANQPRVGMQTGHFEAPYEEPWLERRQGRQQGQQAQFEPHAAPPRHGMHFGDQREEQWGWNDQDEAWFDPEGGRQARERPRAKDPRPMKLDFPRFKGGDPTAWVYMALQYFHYYQVPEPEKVMHASYHLDEEALVWFQDCEHELHGWNDFVRAIQIRFGPASYDDPMELLTKLKQTHSIAAYKSQFELTSNRVRDLSDMHKLSYFMSGMKDEIKLAVKMQGPRNLGEAYVLAKIKEEYLATVKRSTRPTYEPSRGSWVQSQAQQGVSQVENKNGDSKQFSARPSMQVQSTHNFMDETLAKTLKLPIDGESNFGVRVANGQYWVSQWLSTLGMINWDFKNLMMGFMHEGKKVWLQGLKEKPNLIQGSKDFKGKATMKGLLFQIMPCRGSPVVWTLWKGCSLLASKRCSSYMGALVQAPRRLPTPCGQGVLDGGGNVKTPTIPHPWLLRVVPWLLLAIANRSLDLDQPMGGLI
uniref:Ty3 transposon capsid-like protein domain-containing protein n=1 Tax=Fagus sylvatica TaxID=28930 RepID=A0A2N9FVG6_FAGSY